MLPEQKYDVEPIPGQLDVLDLLELLEEPADQRDETMKGTGR